MPRVESSRLVHAPAERVFGILVDVSSSPSWLAGVSEAAFVSPPPHVQGARFRQVRTTMGRASRVDGTFVALDPPRRLVLDIARDGKPAGTVVWALQPEGGATRVTSTIDFQLPGLMKLMTPVVKGAIARQNADDLASLARKAEAP